MTAAGKPPSSIDVARQAGVSQSAVSRTFTPGACVSDKTRAKVMAAADALGYRPSLIPRIMLTNRSGIVAVVVGGIDNPYHAAALEAFSRTLQARGHQVMLVQVESGWEFTAALERLAGYRVDAVVSALQILNTQVAETLDALSIPVVTLNSNVTSAWTGAVNSDNEAAGAAIARLLHARGGRRFAYMAGPEASLAQRQREAGFNRALAELGVDAPQRAAGDYSHASGMAAARTLFAGPERPDALFCANDLMAFGAMDLLRGEMGLGLPGAVKVAGYDNIEAASWPAYDLTTVDQDIPALVGRAVDLIEADWSGGQAHTVAARIVERSSTRMTGTSR